MQISCQTTNKKNTFLKLKSLVCKIKKNHIFSLKNLHISKKSSTFAQDLKNNINNNLKNYIYGREN